MPQTIGIVGGGQLGRMLSEAAFKMDYRVTVVDPTPDCPARQVGAEQILGGYKDVGAISILASKSDFVTIEFEHINTAALAKAADSVPVNPLPATISLIQDKYEQKKFLAANGFPTAPFTEISNFEQAEKVYKDWDGKMIIKSKTEAFDGRGNAKVEDKSQLPGLLDKFGHNGIYAEKIIDFKKELAVMIAKDKDENTVEYPIVETVHTRNICTEVYAPASIDQKTADEATDIARRAVLKLQGAGVYGIEMFLDQKGLIMINEIAPRVHNSGHYTMDMCDVSQFEQHIRVITGQPVQKPHMKVKYCCMVNILGERDGPVELEGVESAEKISGVSVYLYGKGPTRIDRKMGHINAVAGTMEEAKANALRARKLISI